MLVKNNIIFAYIFLALSFQAGAEEEKKDLKILLEFAPDAIIQNEPFTLNILVNHPDPDEIYMEPPDFHGAFTMERMRVETRFVLSSPREGDRWTDFEFLLTAIETGSQRLAPFQITVFEETVKTNPVNVYVREEKLDTKIALAWFGEGGRGRVYPVRIGDSREVALRITNWRESSVYPAIPLRIEAPQNAIIEGAALSKNDRDAGIILRLKIIPLDEKPIIINRQSVYYEKNPLEIPALQVNVLPAAVKGEKGEEKKAGETSYGETAFIQTTFTAQKTEEASANPYVSFSTLINNNKNIFILLREGIDDCVNEAALLWSQGQYAAALAALRRGERVLTAGYAVRTARIICENMLKLPPSPREPWLPHRPLLFIFTFSAAVFIFLFFIKKTRYVSIFFHAVFFCVFIAALSALFFSYEYGKTRAVLKQCAAYPIPEETAKASVFFMEGEPARVRSKSGVWTYAESLIQNAPKKSGWIKEENIY